MAYRTSYSLPANPWKRDRVGKGCPAPLRNKVEEVLAGKDLTAEQRRMLEICKATAAWYCWSYMLEAHYRSLERAAAVDWT
jgi:hypothetical protein